MNISTVFYLSLEDVGECVEEGEKIKIDLENGEVFIGKYQSSDHTSLTIERFDNSEMDIEFEDIKYIEKVEQC